MSEAKTVKLTDLVPDRCNFKDRAFELAVGEFMARNMPGFPLGLLQTNGESAYERWEIQPEERFKVSELHLVVYACHSCEEEYPHWAHDEEPEVCCPLETLAEAGEVAPFEVAELTWLVLRDTHYAGDPAEELAGEHQINLPKGGSVWGWYPEARSDAENKANEMNSEAMHEGMYGFPWANSWFYCPDDFIEAKDLKEAGFTVATYCGGEGDWRSDQSFRLCGIDGGGYSFKGAHFAEIYFLTCLRRGWEVATDNGKMMPEGEEE
tara:strand:+ start:2283 stop:3077 length:795 start_codon:yes stop_codon:yes gene_type:complete